MFILSKVSLPNVWSKEFSSESEVAIELRKHLCETCLLGYDYYSSENGDWTQRDYEFSVDVFYENKRYECLDVSTLLSTGCGLEFELEENDN